MSLTKVTYAMIEGAVANVLDYGADNTGATDCSTSIAAAFAVANEIFFPAGTYLISNNLTIPYDNVIVMAGGAKFSVASGKTLKIEGQFIAPINQQVFEGSGLIKGIRAVYPEWFGAVGDGIVNDQSAFQKCITCITDSLNSAGGKCYVYLSAKNYAFSSPWIINLSSNYGINIQGSNTSTGGTKLIAKTGFNFASGGLINLEGTTSPNDIVDFCLSGFSLENTDVNSGTGIYFNFTQTNFIQGKQQSLIENVSISGFAIGILINRLRQINFSRVSVLNTVSSLSLNACVQIKDAISGTGAGITGDISWTNCKFLQPATSTTSYGFYILSSTGNGGIVGIKINGCNFFNAKRQIYIEAANNTQNKDIFISGNEFENCTLHGIEIIQSGGASTGCLNNIHVNNNYFTTVQGNCIKLTAAKSGGINSTLIENNYSNVVVLSAVNAEKINGLNVISNFFSGVSYSSSLGSAIAAIDCNQLNLIGNNFGQGAASLTGSFDYMISLTGTGNYYVVQGNNSAGLSISGLINNTTGAANTSITGNI